MWLLLKGVQIYISQTEKNVLSPKTSLITWVSFIKNITRRRNLKKLFRIVNAVMQNTFFSLHISMNLSNYVGLKQLKTFISSFNGNKKKKLVLK